MTSSPSNITKNRLVIPKRHLEICNHNNSGHHETLWFSLGWPRLRDVLDQIDQHQFSHLCFAEIHKLVCDLVEHNQGHRLFAAIRQTLLEFAENAKKRIVSNSNSTFLQSILNEFSTFRENLLLICSLFMFVDRVHVASKKEPHIFELGLLLFGQSLFQFEFDVISRFQHLIMEQIREERDGTTLMNRQLVKSLVRMTIEIDRNWFESLIESHLLEQTRVYYRHLAQNLSETLSISEYFRHVLVVIKKERERADFCFVESTRTKIEKVLNSEMIQQYDSEKQAKGIVEMLRQWKLEELRLVYQVLSLVDDGIIKIAQIVKQFVTAEGVDLCKSPNSNNNNSSSNTFSLIEEAAQFLEKYSHMVSFSFSSMNEFGVLVADREISSAVKKAFDESINSNPKFCEYLSDYLDSKLKKGKFQISETEFEIVLNRVISLFRHLKDKDVFETYCKMHLASRLVEGQSASDEAEHSFLSKLKCEFGFQFTSKMEGMFRDLKHSQELMTQFKQFLALPECSNPSPPLSPPSTKSQNEAMVNLSVNVLTTGIWPGTSNVRCIMPFSLQHVCELFEAFYLSIHSNRKLTWQFNRGTADLVASFPSKRHEINVSTNQMLILLLFNEAPSLTFEQIMIQTGIPNVELEPALISMCSNSKSHSQLMNCEDNIESGIHKTTEFRINDKFWSKLHRVKISPIRRAQIVQTQTETLAQVEEDRKWQVDAVIVRIMKSRKTEEHRQLVLEVTKQLQSRFLPSLEMIKRRIESLIEREYIDRAPDSRTQYIYQA